MTDIRLNISWYNSLKRKALIRRIGHDGVTAIIDLWLYTAQHRPDGNLSGLSDEDITEAAQFSGDFNTFIHAIGPKPEGLGFLDGDSGSYRLHDWKEHNPWAYHAKARSKAAKRAADERWRKHRVIRGEYDPDAERMQSVDESHMPLSISSSSSSPSPPLTNSVKSKNFDEPGDLLNAIASKVPYTIGSLQASDIIDLEAKIGPNIAIAEFEKCVEWFAGKNQVPRIPQIINWLEKALVERSPKPEKKFTPSVIDPVELDPFSRESLAIKKAREENADKS